MHNVDLVYYQILVENWDAQAPSALPPLGSIKPFNPSLCGLQSCEPCLLHSLWLKALLHIDDVTTLQMFSTVTLQVCICTCLSSY